MSDCLTHLTNSIAELEGTFAEAYPDAVNTSLVEILGGEERHQHQLLEVVREARKLSFQIQVGFAINRLVVTAAPDLSENEEIMGTYAFGLDRVTASGKNALINAKHITITELESMIRGAAPK